MLGKRKDCRRAKTYSQEEGRGRSPQDAEAQPGQCLLPCPPCPSGLTLITVAPGKARAAPPLQRCHRSVGHSVCGSDQSPVTNTRSASGQCEHPTAHPHPQPLQPAQPRALGAAQPVQPIAPALWPWLCGPRQVTIPLCAKCVLESLPALSS